MRDHDDLPASGGPSFSFGTLVGLGFANACSLVAGLAFGHYLDGRFDTDPMWVLIGAVAGLLLGAGGSFMEIRRHLQD